MAKRPEDLSPHYKGNNEGGYGNAPVSGQFKGNKPGPGRPKGSTSQAAAIRKVFSKKIVRKDKSGNVVDQVYPTVALAEKALQLGLMGSFKANEGARQLAERYGPPEEGPASDEEKFDLSLLTDSEFEVFGQILAKLSGDPELTAKPFSDHPLAYLRDVNDPRNYMDELTVEGIQYRRCTIMEVADVVIHPGNRAYYSAVLPRKRGCYRLPRRAENEDAR